MGEERAEGGRIAVVLLNLGAPDAPASVRPFLFNLFYDPAIIRVPNPVRYVLARLLSKRRAVPAGRIYGLLGGRSPLLENTEAQATALATTLADDLEAGVFIAMRYWHPMSRETAARVAAFRPDRVVLLPLYPQFSTTTTASSRRAWARAARSAGIGHVPVHTLCCYPTEPGFIAAMAEPVRQALARASAHGRPRLLFSAHGLPEKVVEAGDPYQWQCEQTAAALIAALGEPGLDWVSCYQSRVGPLTWIWPSTDEEIRRAGRDRVPVVVVPIAFVSEHSETLVEIEIEYRHLAAGCGVPHFERVPTVGADPGFVAGLARLVRLALREGRPVCSEATGRICPHRFGGCPQSRSDAQVSHAL